MQGYATEGVGVARLTKNQSGNSRSDCCGVRDAETVSLD